MWTVIKRRLTRPVDCASQFRNFSASSVVESSALSVLPSAKSEPADLYINPICMQMDKMILKANAAEDILTILVTHRGALFVQNLVTAIDSLADLSLREIPFSTTRKMKFPDQYEEVQRDRLLTDPRYSLLVRDLIEYSGKLDIASIQRILESLQSLNHCHYKLFGAVLRRLYSMEIPPADLSSAISIGCSLEWGGFGRAETFYNRLGDHLISGIQSLSTLDFVNAVTMYSKLPKIYPELLHRFSLETCHRIATLSDRHIGYLSLALSAYGGDVVPSVKSAIRSAANELCNRIDSADLRDLVRLAISLRRTNIGHIPLLTKSLNRFVAELEVVRSQRERLDPSLATISDLSQLVDACAHFGIGDPGQLSAVILPHIQDSVDVVTEEASIRILHTLARFPSAITPSTVPIVNLLIRKIGSTSSTSWEKQKIKLMFIWFSKCMRFPISCDSEIRRFIIDQCLNQYLVARRGYMVPFPEDSKILWDMIVEAGLSDFAEFNSWVPNSPFHADILIREHRVAVLVLSQFDSLNPSVPVGTDAIQCDLIRNLGWEVVAIDRRKIRDHPNIDQIRQFLVHR